MRLHKELCHWCGCFKISCLLLFQNISLVQYCYSFQNTSFVQDCCLYYIALMLLHFYIVCGNIIIISTGINTTQQALKAHFNNIYTTQHISTKGNLPKTNQNRLAGSQSNEIGVERRLWGSLEDQDWILALRLWARGPRSPPALVLSFGSLDGSQTPIWGL